MVRMRRVAADGDADACTHRHVIAACNHHALPMHPHVCVLTGGQQRKGLLGSGRRRLLRGGVLGVGRKRHACTHTQRAAAPTHTGNQVSGQHHTEAACAWGTDKRACMRASRASVAMQSTKSLLCTMHTHMVGIDKKLRRVVGRAFVSFFNTHTCTHAPRAVCRSWYAAR